MLILRTTTVNFCKSYPGPAQVVFSSLLWKNVFVFCASSDCEAEPASAAPGGGKQRTLQARGDPVLCYCGFLAY